MDVNLLTVLERVSVPALWNHREFSPLGEVNLDEPPSHRKLHVINVAP